MFVSDVKVTFNLQVTSTTMKLLPLVRLCLLTWSSITSADQHGPGVISVAVEEGSDAVLPCSLSSKENIEKMVFDWKKRGQKGEGQKEVFLYAAGVHYNNGRAGQDEQFKRRVFHFEEELKFGNASIKVHKTKMADSGNYTCTFPNKQTSHITLVVESSTEYSTGWVVAVSVLAVVVVLLLFALVAKCVFPLNCMTASGTDPAAERGHLNPQ